MRITPEMKIKEVLAVDEEKMIATLTWLAPAFDRLRYPALRKAMSSRVTVSQAARIARIPLAEMLYVLNLSAGEDPAALESELHRSRREDLEYSDMNPETKPEEIAALDDSDQAIRYVDLMEYADRCEDPLPAIARGLRSLKTVRDVLLLRHPFDPIPVREMIARRGYSSWAEERLPGVWFIYFFRSTASAKASAHPTVDNEYYLRSFAAAA